MRFEIKHKLSEETAFFDLKKDGNDMIVTEEVHDKRYIVLRMGLTGLHRCAGLGVDTGFALDDGRIKEVK